VDVLLRYVFDAASSAATHGNGEAEVPLALIALGGYGRGELNPFSDVDVMLLHEQRAEVSPHLKEMVNQILYLLWDSGFKVGHSTRSIKEAIAQANSDMHTKTAMLEARFLAGNKELATEFRDQFRRRTRTRLRRATHGGPARSAQKIRRQRLSARAESEERVWRTA
jgi:[protein-PII] uridylyltransferase